MEKKFEMKEKIDRAIREEKLDKLFDKVKMAACKFEEMNLDKLCEKDFPEIFDIMKDTAETKKYLAEANYYDKITEAMENAEYGEDYDFEGKLGYQRRRDSQGRYMSNRRMGFVPEMYDRDAEYDMGRMYYSTGMGSNTSGGSMNTSATRRGMGSSRYGYSHDKYMNEKQNYSMTDPEDAEKRRHLLSERLDDLYAMAKEEVMDMSPEEKAMWKTNISKLMNI